MLLLTNELLSSVAFSEDYFQYSPELFHQYVKIKLFTYLQNPKRAYLALIDGSDWAPTFYLLRCNDYNQNTPTKMFAMQGTVTKFLLSGDKMIREISICLLETFLLWIDAAARRVDLRILCMSVLQWMSRILEPLPCISCSLYTLNRDFNKV